MDETDVKIAGQWCSVYRAIDEHGQIVDVDRRDQRAADDAAEFFRRALGSTGVTPTRVTTDGAAAYPPVVAGVLPEVEHETGKLVQQRIERDHQHLKGRFTPMRGFQTTAGAQTICQGHGFIRTLRGGYYRLGLVVEREPAMPQLPLLVRVWDELTAELLVGERTGRRGTNYPAAGCGHQPALVPAQLNGTASWSGVSSAINEMSLARGQRIFVLSTT